MNKNKYGIMCLWRFFVSAALNVHQRLSVKLYINEITQAPKVDIATDSPKLPCSTFKRLRDSKNVVPPTNK